jgi:hypothetical protein
MVSNHIGYSQISKSLNSEIYDEFEFDTTTILSERIKPGHPKILKMFEAAGMNPVNHSLSEEELKIVTASIEKLPVLHQQVLRKRLLQISFLDNMPNTALTAPVNPKDSLKLFIITVRAEILHQTVSEWLTEKERGCFDFSNSGLDLRYNAGNLNAFVYVLIHEATHIVDAALGIYSNNSNPNLPEVLSEDRFTKGVWKDRTKVSNKFENELLDSTYFRSRKILPIKKAQEVYKALAISPFVSLYGRNSCHEDFAEFITIKYLNEKFGQKFSIELLDKGQNVYTFKPLKNKFVRSRIKVLDKVIGKMNE